MNNINPEDAFAALVDSNPVSQDSAPSAHSELGKAHLNMAMNQNNHDNISVGSDTAAMRDFAQQRPKKKNFGLPRRAVLGIAAALALVAGSLVLVSPWATDPAVAALQDAAGNTGNFDSGKITISASETFDGDAAVDNFGAVEVTYNDGDIAVTGDIDSETAQARFIDGAAYVEDNGTWTKLTLPDEFSGLAQKLVRNYVNPETVLDLVKDVSEAELVGDVTLDGVVYTKYTATTSIEEFTKATAGLTGFEGSVEYGDEVVEGTITFDIFVGQDEVLRRVDLTGQDDVSAGNLSVVFSELGEVGEIGAPASFDEFDLGGILDAEGLEELEGLEGILGGLDN